VLASERTSAARGIRGCSKRVRQVGPKGVDWWRVGA
jgi:hypothetical protein